MPGHIRRNVTAVIQHIGPTQSTRLASRDLVTFREELFTHAVTGGNAALASALQRQAREMQEATVSARSLPVLGGVYYVQAKFTSVGSTLTVTHGLQQEVAWIASRPRPTFAKWQASTGYTQHQYVVPSTANGFFYSCFLPGTSSAGAGPAFTTFTGQQTADNTVTWLCMGPIAPALYEVSQDTARGRIVLGSSVPCTVDLWFFPQPSAQGA